MSPITSEVKAYNLLTEGLPNPAGVGTANPELSWALSGTRDEAVRGFHLQLAKTSDDLEAGRNLLWDTGDVGSGRPAVIYQGAALGSRDHFVWRVRPVVDRGTAEWSAIATASLGLLHPSDWKADWVTHPDWTTAEPPLAAPVVGTRFDVSRRLHRAFLYVSGLGVYIPELDGEVVDHAVLEPGSSDFAVRVAARAIDMTDRLGLGEHTLTVRLGEGSAHIRPAEGRYSKFTGRRALPAAIAQLELQFADGTTEVIATDSRWLAATTPTTLTHWYGGEEYDGTLRMPTLPGQAGDEAWQPVAVLHSAAQGSALWWRNAPPVVVQESLQPASVVARDADGGGVSIIVDFGTNIAGWPVINVADAALAGAALTIWPSELLGTDGHVDQSTGGSPIFDRYITGPAGSSWHPEFSYHGFRYLEVTGPSELAIPGALDYRADVLHVDDASTGTFRCSDPRLNRLNDLILRAMKSNLFTVPTDCPHREKLGWLEQLHLVFGPMAYAFDIRAHYRDVVTHILDAQTVDGLIPDIAPELTVFEAGFRSDVNWGSAVLEIPWRLYREYGDTRPLVQAWDAGTKYIRYLSAQASGGLLTRHGLGDWITLDDSTPHELVAGYGFVRLLETASKIAHVLGHVADAELYSANADRHKAMLASAFVDPETAVCGSGSQGSYALAIDLGIADERAITNLVSAVRLDGHVTTGEIALPALLRVLRRAGEHRLLHELVTQTKHPGYGQMIDGNLTALAESWDNADHPNSANHFMLGVVGDWLTADVAGLQQAEDSIAWEHVIIAPALLDRISHAEASHRSVFGQNTVAWSRTDTSMSLAIVVPPGARATVTLPRIPGHELSASSPANCQREEDNFRWDVTHGTWTFGTAVPHGRTGAA